MKRFNSPPPCREGKLMPPPHERLEWFPTQAPGCRADTLDDLREDGVGLEVLEDVVFIQL